MSNEAHRCHADGCESAATHKVKVQILCRAPGLVPTPIKMDATIRVCGKHCDEAKVRRYLMQPQNREAITTGIMEGGFPEPDLLSMRVSFERLDDTFVAIEVAPRAEKCSRHGCAKHAKWQIEQHFRMLWQRGKGKPQIKVLTNICVCDEHKAFVKPSDFTDKESESRTREWLNAKGVSMPDFKTMTLGFEPLQNGQRAQARAWVGDNGPLDQFKPEKTNDR